MSPEKADLLAALTVERQTGPWWRRHADHRPAVDLTPELLLRDDDVTCARRRRELVADYEQHREETA